MIITVDADGAEPVYLQIYRQVIEAIATNSLTEGDPLPSTRQLARDLGVNYHTVHKAYELLLARGTIAMAPRSKAVVRSAEGQKPGGEWLRHWQEQIRGLIAEAVALGLAPAEVMRRIQQVHRDVTARSGGTGRMEDS